MIQFSDSLTYKRLKEKKLTRQRGVTMQSTQYCIELLLYKDPETNDSNIRTYSHVVTNCSLLYFQTAVFGLCYFASPLLLPN